MIENFLRPPRGAAEFLADAVRVLGALSVVVAAVFFEWTDAGVVAFTLPGLAMSRFLGLRPVPDIVVSITLLVAAWSNVFALYEEIAWWDLVVHFIAAGVMGAWTYLLLGRLRMVPLPFTEHFTARAGIVLTTVLGLALGALWEMVEWVGYTFITEEIHVEYQDTVSDMAIGGLGALCLGFVVARFPLLRDAGADADAGTYDDAGAGDDAGFSDDAGASHPVDAAELPAADPQ